VKAQNEALRFLINVNAPALPSPGPLRHTYSPCDMKANVLLLLLLFTSLRYFPASAQPTAKAGQAPAKGLFAQPQLVREFKIAVPQQRLDDIMAKVKVAKLPRQMPPAEGSDSNWQTGMDMKWLEELHQYWLTSYNWRDQEKNLTATRNTWPTWMATTSSSTTSKARVRTLYPYC
jgi:hypothetical protein